MLVVNTASYLSLTDLLTGHDDDVVVGLPLTSSFLPDYSSEYLNEYSNARQYRKQFNASCQ